MKVPKPGMLCGWCRKPVIEHTKAVEEFVPIPNAPAGFPLRKQLYHKRRCWSKELRRRLDDQRRLRREHPEHECESDVAKMRLLAEQVVDEKGTFDGKTIEDSADELVRFAAVRSPELMDAHVVEATMPAGTIVKSPGGKPETQLGRNVLRRACEDAILKRAGEWFTKREIMADVAEAGLSTTEESVEQTVYALAKQLGLEQRRIAGTNRKEFRFGVEQAKPLPPPMPPPAPPKVERAQPVRHSDRPGPWEREPPMPSQAARDAVELLAERAAVVEQELKHVVEAAIALPPVKETVMAEQPSRNGQAKVLFMLKSERMLNELERTMMDLVRDAIKQARQELTKLAEDEL